MLLGLRLEQRVLQLGLVGVPLGDINVGAATLGDGFHQRQGRDSLLIALVGELLCLERVLDGRVVDAEVGERASAGDVDMQLAGRVGVAVRPRRPTRRGA